MKDNSCPAGHDPKLAGDPVDTLTGAVVDRMLDFRLTGPLELRWTRHYDSSQSHRAFSVGTGCAHEYDRSLSLDAEGLLYEEPVRRSLRFPPLGSDGEECALHGFTVRRVASTCYLLFGHAQPTMEFVFAPKARRARLTRLLRGSFEVRFWYDAAQKLVRIDDSAGRHLTASEDEAGRLIRLAVEATPTRPGFLLVAYHYDERGNLIATENDQGHGYAFAYDEANRMVLRRGRKGFQFYFKYDAQGRCIRAMGDDRLYGVALEYQVPGRLTKVTRPDLGVWTYTFTPRGELHEIHDPLGGVQKFIRDETGRVALDVDPNGNASTFVYDSAGEAIAKIDSLGHRISLPEDPNAPDPLAHEVAANAAEYEYGRLLNVEEIALPDREEVRDLVSPREALPLVSLRSAAEQGGGPKNGFEVPPLRMLWWPKPKCGRIFNDLGKLLRQRDDAGRQRTWTYDASGNVAEHVDFDGRKWIYDYGSWHFLRGLTDPTGAEVRFIYTPYGEVASFTDAGGTQSEYGYDQKDQLVEIRRHGVVKETYTRDACGNLIAKHAADGRELLRFEIGYGNLPIRRMLASGDEHTFEYDPSGRYLVASTKKDRLEFSYDKIGNCDSEQRNGIGVAHRYQGWRKPAESVFFGRFAVRYEWQGNTLAIIDPGGQRHEIRFLGHGLTERCLGNGSRELAQYDNLGRCLFKQAERRGGQVWIRCYQWSGEGELRRIRDNVRGEVRHEYDMAHRLRCRIVNGQAEIFQMDEAGNLLQQPGLGNVQLMDGNRIKAANGETFAYNDRNNTRARHGPRGTTTYGYDSRDQLVRVETPEGLWEASYDALGRRTRKTWAGGEPTEYYWNSDQLIAEVGRRGQLRLYIYADPLALNPLLVLDYASLESAPEACRRCFVFSDQIGTPCLLEDEGGVEVWRAEIAPFGNAELAPTNKIDFNLRFPGHYFDVELALHYNRFRYYDPHLARYLQSDPWGISGGHNLYAYRPNPVLSVDVDGLGEDSNPSCRRREGDAEGNGSPETQPPRRMTPEELQSAADYIRHGGGPHPNDWSTLTITEGMENGRPVHTVTSSRVPLTPETNLTNGELRRAREVFGNDVRTPVPGRNPPGDNTFHAEQRGARATQDQTDRRQASSNQTATTRRDPDVGHMGAACGPCAACQRGATNSRGEPNPIENVTGTIEEGGRTNTPRTGAWRGYR